jgi:hypothetical protein
VNLVSDTHDVISAFLDDEPFDSNVLIDALSEPAGRDLLIDLIALRHLAQTDGKNAHALTDHTAWRSSLRALAAVAAIIVALAGGYLAGARRYSVAMSEAPPATRVIQAPAAWEDLPAARMR